VPELPVKGEEARAVSYKVSATGMMNDILTVLKEWKNPGKGSVIGSLPKIQREMSIGSHVKGFLADYEEARGSGYTYAILSRCVLQQGFECRLEFHQMLGSSPF